VRLDNCYSIPFLATTDSLKAVLQAAIPRILVAPDRLRGYRKAATMLKCPPHHLPQLSAETGIQTHVQRHRIHLERRAAVGSC
jgi:hypothetical protein